MTSELIAFMDLSHLLIYSIRCKKSTKPMNSHPLLFFPDKKLGNSGYNVVPSSSIFKRKRQRAWAQWCITPVLVQLLSCVPLSEYKTCTHTTDTIHNLYKYHCHNTKRIYVPLSQYKTYIRTTVTIQNIYTYHCHNTKHVHVPLSQCETCTRTTTYCNY
jgi:hypothetical protein